MTDGEHFFFRLLAFLLQWIQIVTKTGCLFWLWIFLRNLISRLFCQHKPLRSHQNVALFSFAHRLLHFLTPFFVAKWWLSPFQFLRLQKPFQTPCVGLKQQLLLIWKIAKVFELKTNLNYALKTILSQNLIQLPNRSWSSFLLWKMFLWHKNWPITFKMLFIQMWVKKKLAQAKKKCGWKCIFFSDFL